MGFEGSRRRKVVPKIENPVEASVAEGGAEKQKQWRERATAVVDDVVAKLTEVVSDRDSHDESGVFLGGVDFTPEQYKQALLGVFPTELHARVSEAFDLSVVPSSEGPDGALYADTPDVQQLKRELYLLILDPDRYEHEESQAQQIDAFISECVSWFEAHGGDPAHMPNIDAFAAGFSGGDEGKKQRVIAVCTRALLPETATTRDVSALRVRLQEMV